MKTLSRFLIFIFTVILSLTFLSSCLDADQSPDSTSATQNVTDAKDESSEGTSSNTSESEEETSAEAPKDPNEGLTKAPELTLSDMSGKSVKLSDFIGKPIVLNFWASWCGPCKSEFPAFAEVCREYNGDVVFLFVNCFDGATETMRTVQSFLNSNGYGDLPIYLDKTNARQAYGVSAIPFTFFINTDGYIVSSVNASISKDRLLSGIAQIHTVTEETTSAN